VIGKGRDKGGEDSSTIDAQGFPHSVDFGATSLSVDVLLDEGPVELLDMVCGNSNDELGYPYGSVESIMQWVGGLCPAFTFSTSITSRWIAA
jgi:hypothetical protein